MALLVTEALRRKGVESVPQASLLRSEALEYARLDMTQVVYEVIHTFNGKTMRGAAGRREAAQGCIGLVERRLNP